MNRQRQKQNKRKVSRRPQQNLLANRPSFALQPLATHWVESFNTKLTTTVTSGQIASVINIDPTTLITNWATRFQTLYEEYRVVGAKMRLLNFSSNNPGTMLMFWDEKSATAPTNTTASERATKRVNAGSVDRAHTMTWNARDLLDLQYTPIGTSVVPVYWKLFTNSANNGSSAVATDYCTVDFKLHIQFRGFVAV